MIAGCGGEDPADAPAPAPAEQTTAPTGETTTGEAPPTTTEADDNTVIQIVVADGKARVTKGSLRVRQGDALTLVVKADVEDEIHLHGYDLAVGTAPGQPGRINSVADQAGAFIIELEEHHLHLGRSA